MVAVDGEAPLGRKVECMDSVEPSGLSQALRALQLAFGATGLTRYGERLEALLARLSAPMHAARLEMAASLSVAQVGLGPHWQVVVCGEPGPESEALVRAAAASLRPNVQVICLPPRGLAEELEGRFPALGHKLALARRATAYPCQRGSCRRPTQDPADLAQNLSEGWAWTAP